MIYEPEKGEDNISNIEVSLVEEFRVPSELAVGESHTSKLGKTLNKHDGHCQQKSSATLKLVYCWSLIPTQ